MRFLLSTGKSTDKVELYVVDLFKLYLNVYPNDIPGDPELGFKFIMTDTFKDDLVTELRNRLVILIARLQKRFDTKKVTISLKTLEVISETQAKLVISVNKFTSEEIFLNLYED